MTTGDKFVSFTPSASLPSNNSDTLGLQDIMSTKKDRWQQVFLACGDSQECIRLISKLASSVGREMASVNAPLGDSMWEQQLINVGHRLGHMGSLPYSTRDSSYDGNT